MAAADSTISLRLPAKMRRALDDAAKRTRRSRAFIVKEALDRYLNTVLKAQSASERRRKFDKLLAMQGAGTKSGYRSAEEIHAMIREIRGDD
jgi:predicted DNA-binding protein